MATIKQTIARNTGAGSAATRYRKSAAVSARAFTSNRNFMRRRSTGGSGG